MYWRGACVECPCTKGRVTNVDVAYGFRQDRGYTDQVFKVRQVCEKYLAIGKDVFWAFMDLEMAYDIIDRHGIWQML